MWVAFHHKYSKTQLKRLYVYIDTKGCHQPYKLTAIFSHMWAMHAHFFVHVMVIGQIIGNYRKLHLVAAVSWKECDVCIKYTVLRKSHTKPAHAPRLYRVI